jgi:2-polyprenyl-3-methyl-5-hydroxy-6-metoxy-1,4-benzoquinol methylase
MANSSPYRLSPHPTYGFLQIEPTPSLAEINEFYKSEFYSSNQNFNDSGLDVQLKDKEWYDLCRQRVFDNMTELFGEDMLGKALLDIGCGWGEALSFFQEKGMDCYGLDPVPEAVAYANRKGLKVIESQIENVNIFSRQFHVVTLFNVLEHLADPVSVLEKIYKELLISGGLLIVDVPNEFNAFQLTGRDVHQLHDWWVTPPCHLNYFNTDTLCNLLTGIGYEIKLTESSFPIEIFLLFGENYVGNSTLGRQCHEKRMNFEMSLCRFGRQDVLKMLYRSLASLNLGRQVTAYAIKE